MVLVDTSVWVRFFRDQTAYADELSRLLDIQEVARHELVYGELLMGDCGGRARMLHVYSAFQQLPTIGHDEVVSFVRVRDLAGRGIGWIDTHLLASAIASNAKLWTADKNLFLLACELGVAHIPPGVPQGYLV